MGQIRVMTPRAGDETIKWDADDEKSVKKAQKKFDKLKEKGYKLFKTVQKTVSEKGEEVASFDPTEQEYIAVPAMAGG